MLNAKQSKTLETVQKRLKAQNVVRHELPPDAVEFLWDEELLDESSKGTVEYIKKSIRLVKMLLKSGALDWSDLEENATCRPRTQKPEATSSDQLIYPGQEELSVLYAALANESSEVQAFRREFLSGGLLVPEGVIPWLQKQKEADGPDGMLIPITILAERLDQVKITPREVVIDPSLEQRGFRPFKNGFERPCLWYAVPGDEQAHHMLIAPEGTLAWLWWLSQKLAKKFLWTEATATGFVLTGYPPLVQVVTASIDPIPESSPDLPPELASSVDFLHLPPQINLSAHPMLTMQQVAQVYTRYKEMIPSPTHPEKGVGHSKRLLYLGLFAQTHSKDKGKTWEIYMQEWNEKYPDLTIKIPANFQNGVKEGKRRLRDMQHKLHA